MLECDHEVPAAPVRKKIATTASHSKHKIVKLADVVDYLL